MSTEDQYRHGYIINTGKSLITLAERTPGELVRKSLHLLIALVPVLASVNLSFTLSLLASGILFYAFAEAARKQGQRIFIVSDLTLIASRDHDKGKFVLGPVTLGLGAMMALILYPEPAATIAIYALAFGDGFASLVGKSIHGPKIPLLQGKTFAGSGACFVAVFLVTFRVTANPSNSLFIAFAATVLEAAPLGDFDNIIIPFGVGLAATRMLFV